MSHSGDYIKSHFSPNQAAEGLEVVPSLLGYCTIIFGQAQTYYIKAPLRSKDACFEEGQWLDNRLVLAHMDLK